MPRPTPEHSAAEPQPKWHGHPGRDRFTGWKPVPQSLCRHRRVSGRVVPRGRAATKLWHGHPGRDRFTGWKPVPQSRCRHRRVSGRVVPRGRAATKVWHGHPGRDRFTGWKPVPQKSSRAAKKLANSSTGQIIRRGGGLIVAPAGKRCAAGENRKKDVKSDERSRNVYENKGSTVPFVRK